MVRPPKAQSLSLILRNADTSRGQLSVEVYISSLSDFAVTAALVPAYELFVNRNQSRQSEELRTTQSDRVATNSRSILLLDSSTKPRSTW
jgi:hypothetical protein